MPDEAPSSIHTAMSSPDEALGRDILDSLSAHIAVLDANGKILAVNEAWRRFAAENGGEPGLVSTGINYFAACEAAGPVRSDHLANTAMQGIRSVLEGTLPSFTLEYPCHGPGSPRWFLLHVRPLSGSRRGAVVAHENITERKALEAQVRHANKMEAIGNLAGGVAHDFNNLLTVILGNTSHALADAALATETRLALAEIVAASQRAAALTRQLLTFSRRQPIRLQFLDLNTATASLINMLRRLIGEDIALECRCAKEPLWLHADAGMLDQVLVNLTVNSRDAMPEGGRLLIETTQVELDATTASRHPRSRQGTFAQLSITDTGHGIAPDHLNQIFEPFFTTKPTGSGTGIGLATVHTIVEQHQGWIEVSSVVGQGTTFHVYLPIATPNTLPVLQPTPVQDAPQGRGQRILLVEDDSSLLSLTTRVLERHGYRVKAAGSSLTALSLWHQDSHRFDLLLTDLILPGGLSGFDLAQRFQQERPALRVLYCSGYSPELTRRDPLHGHRATMLEKPYLPEDLLRAVHTSLATQPTS